MAKKLFKVFADKLATSVASFMGSWWSVISFFALAFSWMLVNTIQIFSNYSIDPFPFSFLNLVLGIMAAITGPLVIIGNKSQEKRYQKMIESIYAIEKRQDEFLSHLRRYHHQVISETKKKRSI